VQNRKADIEIVPSAASLLIKALKEPPRDRKKVKNSKSTRLSFLISLWLNRQSKIVDVGVFCTSVKHNGNLSLNDVYDIARKMRTKSMARTFTGTVKEILGTANSLGCTIDGQSPKAVQAKVESGELVTPDA
jgi:large subunit ribosomal protein L12e